MVNYAKILKDIILITYQFENPIWSNEAVTIVSHIFWLSIYYTFNIRLAMFLSDRAIILFNEYIEIIKSTYTNESNLILTKQISNFISINVQLDPSHHRYRQHKFIYN